MGFLTGKTVIVTGGGRAVLSDGRCGSIGYGIATAYAKEGANVVITGRNVKKLEDAKEELERLYGIKVLAVAADVSAGADNEAVVANVVKQTIDTFISKLSTMACKAAIKGNTSISFKEADTLIDQLMKLENPYTCPHGRPTLISMTETELEKKFKRIV